MVWQLTQLLLREIRMQKMICKVRIVQILQVRAVQTPDMKVNRPAGFQQLIEIIMQEQ